MNKFEIEKIVIDINETRSITGWQVTKNGSIMNIFASEKEAQKYVEKHMK
jgi:hypothetical protein